MILLAALGTIVLGGFGTMCMSNCCNKCWLAVIYGVMLFIFWIVFVSVGGVITTISVAGPAHIEDVCGKEDHD